MSTPPVSAYIPCCNNAETLGQVIAGLQEQTVPIDDLYLVDDGSTDDSREIAAGLGVRVVKMGANLGRGAVRARAMAEARHNLVLSCDATNRMRPDFLEKALHWIAQPGVIAVTGRLIDPAPRTATARWRARHLFRQEDIVPEARHHNGFTTTATLLWADRAAAVGGYNPALRHGEDLDLHRRLDARGGDVVFEPLAIAEPLRANQLGQVMERYVRWNHGNGEQVWRNFLEAQIVALRILVPLDLRARDLSCAAISILMPYFQLAHSYRLRRADRAGKSTTSGAVPGA